MLRWFPVALLILSGYGLDVFVSATAPNFQWVGVGLTSGCRNNLMMGKLEVPCALPSGRVVFRANRGGDYITVECLNTTYSCDEIKEAKPYILNYISEHRTRTVDYMIFDSCQPPPPLSCVLDLIHAGDVRGVKFEDLEVDITGEHLEGLRGVKSVVIDAGPNLTSIPFTTLSKLPTLEYLKITHGANLRLTNVSGEPIVSLQKFEFAEGGDTVILTKEFLSKMPNIVKLNIYGKVVGIEGDAFDATPLLQNVSLNSNKMTSIPPTLFANTPSIKYFDIYNNKLKLIQTDTFKGLKELKEILLFGNIGPLKIESSTFANLPSLINLDLHDSDIDSLPPDVFTNSTNIQTLDLSKNKLATLPDVLFSKINLKILNLSHNFIRMLADILFEGQNGLTLLDLSFNDLTVLPGGIFRSMRKLNVLNLSNNKLVSLDGGAFNGLNKLTELYLDYNKLTTLEERTFDLLSNLQILSISHNSLSLCAPLPSLEFSYSNFDTSPFSSNRDLLELNLQYNNITNICYDWRNSMVFLKKLNLSHNYVGELSDIDINFLGPTTVDLTHNNITTVRPPYTTSDDTINLSVAILLDNNPFTCDCNIYSLVQFVENKPQYNTMDLKNAQCVNPPTLSGDKLLNLSPDLLVCEETECPQNCECLTRPFTSHFEIYCDILPDLFPDSLPPSITGAELSLKTPTDLIFIPQYVEFVNLTNLNLTEPPMINSSIIVDLRRNLLTLAPMELLEKNCSLYLSENPFKCDCTAKESLLLLNKYKNNILDYNQITCENGKLISSINTDLICVLRYSIIVISILALITTLSITIILSYYKNRVFIRIILRKLGFTIADVLPEGIKYDAFISFAHQDERIVIDKILPNLEGRKKLKLCIHSRDWIVGDWIPEQITRSIDQSRCTIIVLSKSFVESIWGSLEFRTAHGKGRIIILLIDDVYLKSTLDSDLKAYLTLNTYIKLEDPLVWERLTDAILIHGPKNIKTLEEIKNKTAPVLLDVKINEEGKLVNTASARA